MDPEIYCQMREVEDTHWWFAARRSIITTVIATLDLPPESRILDVGSGTGGNLEMLSRFGAVTSIEEDEMAIALCATRNSASILKGRIPDDLTYFHEEFDLIILLDVLEHIEEELAALKSLVRLLTPNGVLVITVPAFPFLWSDHDEQHHHKRRYQYSTLKRVVQESGLSVFRMTYFNTWLFPIIAAVRLFRKLKPSRVTGSDNIVPSPWVNTILKALFTSERHLVTRLRLPFGTSILAIAKKGFKQQTEHN
jgi:2-polyprenyl-3-methyl-5-hydroxy-6-metoxy-1,4-benzoquinol methylase